MSAMVKKILHTWNYGILAILFVVCLVFCISGRFIQGITFEQHIISSISDHYYLTYFLLPVILLSIFPFINDDSEQVILRFGSYENYFKKKWISLGILVLLIMLVQTLAILLSSVGLEFGNTWNVLTGTEVSEMFSHLSEIFSNPLSAFISYSLYEFFGIWFISGICMWITHFFKDKMSMKIIIGIYIFSALWIKVSILQSIPFTGFNHLIMLHHNLGSLNRFILTIISSLVIFLIMIISIKFWWKGNIKLKRKYGVANFYFKELMIRKNILILCVIVFGILIYKGLANNFIKSSQEWIYLLFSGHGIGYFQVLPFLEMMIVNIAPIYILGIFLERIIKGQSAFVSIRTSGYKEIMNGILNASIKFILIYTMLWFIAGIIGSLIFGNGLNADSIKMLIYMVSIKTFDILFQYLIMMVFYLFTKNVTFSFLALIVGNILCIFNYKCVSYIPFGLSSALRTNLLDISTGLSITTIFVILIILIILMLLLIKKIIYRKLSS